MSHHQYSVKKSSLSNKKTNKNSIKELEEYPDVVTGVTNNISKGFIDVLIDFVSKAKQLNSTSYVIEKTTVNLLVTEVSLKHNKRGKGDDLYQMRLSDSIKISPYLFYCKKEEIEVNINKIITISNLKIKLDYSKNHIVTCCLEAVVSYQLTQNYLMTTSCNKYSSDKEKNIREVTDSDILIHETKINFQASNINKRLPARIKKQENTQNQIKEDNIVETHRYTDVETVEKFNYNKSQALKRVIEESENYKTPNKSKSSVPKGFSQYLKRKKVDLVNSI